MHDSPPSNTRMHNDSPPTPELPGQEDVENEYLDYDPFQWAPLPEPDEEDIENDCTRGSRLPSQH